MIGIPQLPYTLPLSEPKNSPYSVVDSYIVLMFLGCSQIFDRSTVCKLWNAITVKKLHLIYDVPHMRIGEDAMRLFINHEMPPKSIANDIMRVDS